MAKKRKPEAMDDTPNAVMIEIDAQGNRKEWPYHRSVLPPAMQNLPMTMAVDGWLQQVTLDTVISLWYQAQGKKFEKIAREESRRALQKPKGTEEADLAGRADSGRRSAATAQEGVDEKGERVERVGGEVSR